MASRANIKATVSADTTQFSTAMRRAGTQAALVSRRIGKSMLSATRAIGGIAASATKAAASIGLMGGAIVTAGLAKGIKDAADLGGRLSDLSAQTGAAAGQLAILQRALEDNGVSGEEVGGILNKMQRIISDAGDGMESAARPFEQLGITIEELRRLKPDEQFRLIGQRINGIVDPTERAQTAMEIFGRSGGKLLTLFADASAFGNATKFLGTQAEILDRSSVLFDSIADKLARIPDKLTGFFVGFLEPIAGDVDAILQKFDNYDFAALGLRLSEAMNMENVIRIVSAGVPLLVAVLADAFAKALDVAGALMRAFFSPEGLQFLKNAMIDTFVATFDAIGGAAYELGKVIAAALKGEVKMVDVTRIIGTDKPDGAPDFADRVQSELDNIDWAPSQAVKDAADRFGVAFEDIFPKVGKKSASEANLYDRELAEQRERMRRDEASMKQQDGTLFGPSKSLANAPEIFGPSKSLMNRPRMFGEAGRALGLDNVFAKDRERLGISGGLGRGSGRWAGVANAGVTGGLGEKRRLRTSKDDKDAKKNMSLQEKQVSALESIDSNIKQAVTVG